MRVGPFIAVVSLVSCGVAGCEKTVAQNASGELPAPTSGTPLDPRWRDSIKTETVRASDTPEHISTTGRVSFDEDNTQHVGAPVNGRVASMKVKLGDKVRVGQALVELSSTEVAQMQAEVKKSQEDLELARKVAKRVESLMHDGAVSAKEVAQAEADLLKAQAEAERGDAQLAALGIRATDPVVRAALYARVNGTVVQRQVLVGQEVRADSGTPLLIITNLDTVWVLADIYEQDLAQVAVGAKVEVRVVAYPGEVFAGRVAYIGDVVDPQSRTVKVRCVMPNPGARLKPEMFARVDLQTPQAGKAIYIPSEAIVSSGNASNVLLLDPNNMLLRRRIEVGNEVGGKLRILAGLADGDVIVTRGALYLNSAMRD